jgi:hypothetical protein
MDSVMKQSNPFKKINFDTPWNEEEWERFFLAQETFVRQADARRRSFFHGKTRVRVGVLGRLGIDPDSVSVDLDLEPTDDLPEARQMFPVLYGQAQGFSAAITCLCLHRLNRVLTHSYKSSSHRALQGRVRTLVLYGARIPRFLAAGHALGYDSEGIKGNTVRCRMAFHHSDHCLGLLTRFSVRELSPQEQRTLFRDALRLRNALGEWVGFLRNSFGKTSLDLDR